MEGCRHIARRVVMRYLTSSSTLPGATPRVLEPNFQQSNSPATFVDNSPKREKKLKEESIYEIDDADDKTKLSPGGTPKDTRDWTHLQPQYLKPSVPDNVRR